MYVACKLAHQVKNDPKHAQYYNSGLQLATFQLCSDVREVEADLTLEENPAKKLKNQLWIGLSPTKYIKHENYETLD